MLKIPQRAFNLALEQLITEELLVETNGIIGLWNHEVNFSEDEQANIQAILAEFSANPMQPPSLREEREKYGDDLISAMIDKEYLIALEEDIAILPQTAEKIRADTIAYFKREATITLGQFRDLFQTSRKYALAFLEYLDRQNITTREGDVRKLSVG